MVVITRTIHRLQNNLFNTLILEYIAEVEYQLVFIYWYLI